MTPLRIDFVSDISCPWCVIGLGALEQALARLQGEVEADIHFQPFELNPGMPPGGEDIAEHLARKYGSSDAQRARVAETLRQRGEEVGFEFRPGARQRIYNTFTAHRLLHWAGEVDAQAPCAGEPPRQLRLKKALFNAYFTQGHSPESPEVLLEAVRAADLDPVRAAEIITSEAYADAVRDHQARIRELDIHAVPATIIDGRHLIPGGQTADVFERILRKLASRQT